MYMAKGHRRGLHMSAAVGADVWMDISNLH